MAGKEVVQLYVSAPQTGLKKPIRELKDFGKTPLLQPGESKVLEFEIPIASLCSFDENSSSWVLEKGVYRFLAGNSSENILGTQDVDIQTDFSKKCADVLKVKQKFEILGK